MRIKKIYWTPWLREKFEEYKTGKMMLDYCKTGEEIEFICFKPLTVTRFLTLVGSEHFECYPEPEQPKRTHEQAMKEFDGWLKRKRW